METITLRTRSRTEFVDVTGHVETAVRDAKVARGVCLVSVPHTTAAVTINENADPDVTRDLIKELDKIVPFDDDYAHTEGNSAAHLKSTLVGSSLMLPIEDGRLVLGTWQGIYFCEFDGPRTRKMHVQVLGA